MEKSKEQRIQELAIDYHLLLERASERREVLSLQTDLCITLQDENIKIAEFMKFYYQHYVN